MAKPSDISIKIGIDIKQSEQNLKRLEASLRTLHSQITSNSKKEQKLQEVLLGLTDKKQKKQRAAATEKLKQVQDSIRIDTIAAEVLTKNLQKVTNETAKTLRERFRFYAKHAESRKALAKTLADYLVAQNRQSELQRLKDTNFANNKIIADAKKAAEQTLAAKLKSQKIAVDATRRFAQVEKQIISDLAKNGIKDFQLSETYKQKLLQQIENGNIATRKRAEAEKERIRKEAAQKQKAIDNETKANFVALLRERIRVSKEVINLETELQKAKAQKIKFSESEITRFKIALRNRELQEQKKNDALTKAAETAKLNDLKRLHKAYINQLITENKGVFNITKRINELESQNIKFTASEVAAFQIKAERLVAKEKKRLKDKQVAEAKRAASEQARIVTDEIKRQINESKTGIKIDQEIARRKVAGVKFTETQIYQLKKANADKAAQAQKQASDKEKADAKKAAEDKKAIFLKETQFRIQQSTKGYKFESILMQATKQEIQLSEKEILALRIANRRKYNQFLKQQANKTKQDDKKLASDQVAIHYDRIRKLILADATYTATRLAKDAKIYGFSKRQEINLTNLIERENKKREKSAKDSAKKQMNATKQAYSTMGQAAQSFASSIDQYVIYALQAATLSMAALSVQVIRVGASFEQAVATLGAIRGQAGAALKPFEEQARLLGETTAFTATEAARGMQELARAGMQTGDIISSSNAALKFAGANATDMTTSTTLLAATMAQFGLSASQSTRVVDTFTTALQNSLLNVQTLQVAMRYAGAVGASFGRSLEETTAMVALFRDLGLEGSTAGTQFRQSFLRLASPTKKAKAALERYGIALADVNPRVNTFQEILQTLADSGIAADLPAIKELVSIRAAGSFSKILSDVADGSSKLSGLLEAFEKGAGVTEKTYSDMINTVSGQTAILKSVVEETFLKLFDVITLKGINPKNNPVVNLLKSLQKIFQDVNIGIDNFAARYQSIFEDEGNDFVNYLNKNSSEIAASFIALMDMLIKLVRFTLEWKDTLILAFQALISFRLGMAVFNGLSTAIKGVQYAVIAFTGSTSAAAASIGRLVTAITGPVGIIAAIATMAASYVALNVVASEYEETQRRIALGIKAGTEASGDYYKELDLLRISSDKVREINTEILKDLVNAETPTQIIDGIQQELDAVERLTEEQQREKLQKGEIIKINTKYGEQLFSNIALEKLQASAVSDSVNVEKERGKILQELNDQSLALSSKLVDLQSEQNLYRHFVKEAGPNQTHYKEKLEETTVALEKVETRLTLTRDRYKGLKRSIAEAADTQERQAAITLQTIELQEGLNKEQAVSNEQTEDQIDLLELLNAALQARLDLEKEIADAKVEQFGTEQDKAIKAEKDRIREIERVFAEEYGLREVNAKETIELQRRLYQALAQDRANRAKKELDDLKDELDSLLGERLNSIGKLKRVFKEEELVIKQAYSSFLKAEDESFDNLLAREKEHYEEKYRVLIEQLDRGEITEEQFRTKALKFHDEHLLAVEKLTKDSDKRVQDQKEATDKLLLQKEIDLSKSILAIRTKYSKDIMDLQKLEVNNIDEFIEKLTQLSDKQKEIFSERGEDYQGLDFYAEFGFLVEQGKKAQLEFAQSLLTGKNAAQENKTEIQKLGEAYLENRKRLKDAFENLKTYNDEVSKKEAPMKKARNSTILFTQSIGFLSKTIGALGTKISDQLPSGLKEIANLFGGATRSVSNFAKSTVDIDNLSNSIFKLQGFIKDTKELSFGQALLIQLKMIDGSFFKDLKSGIKSTFGSFRGFFTSIGSLFKNYILAYLSLTVKLLKNISKLALKASIEIAKISFDKLKSGLDFLTGGVNFNPFEIINDALSEFAELSEEATEKQKELQEQLAAGDITQAEFDEANAYFEQQKEQGASPDQIQAFANNFVSEISDRIKMIAQVAGPVLQAIAAEIPNLVQTFIAEIPKIVTSLTAALPDFFFAILDGLTAVFTTLTEQIKNTSSEAASSFFSELSTKLVNFIGSFAGFITAAIQQIVANLPQIIGGLTQIINGLITALGSIMTTLISGLPDIATALLDGLVSIIDNLGPILRNIITTIADMLPDLLISIADAIPKLLGSLGRLLGDVLIGLASAIPKVITAFMNALPRIITGLIEGAIEFVMAIVEAVPDIIVALVAALPDLIIAIITKFPRMVIELVALIIRALPQIAFRLVMALLVELPAALIIAARDFAVNFVEGVKKFFKDAIQRIKDALTFGLARTEEEKAKAKERRGAVGDFFLEAITLTLADTATFGDTPHPIRAGTDGLAARFAAGDYIIAAQEPVELMRQSLMAMGGNLSSFVSNLSSSMTAPNIAPPPIMQGGGSSQVDIAVMADGRLLDAIQVRAMDNGNAPKMEKKFRRSSGATVGFNRGRFNKFGKR